MHDMENANIVGVFGPPEGDCRLTPRAPSPACDRKGFSFVSAFGRYRGASTRPAPVMTIGR
jgi:hypothetical protein